MEWLNFRHLYAFWMVARHGGFKHAAKRMHISQSSVSEHVAQLESYFNYPLLERTTRRVTLTPQGQQLLHYAETIFSQSREINQIMRQGQAQGLPSILKVGMVGSISRNLLFQRFSELFDRNDSIHIDVTIGAYRDLTDMLLKSDIDLLIATRPPERRHLQQLAFNNIGTTPLTLAGLAPVMRRLGGSGKTDTPLYVYNYAYEGDFVQDILRERMGLRVKPRLLTEDISLLRFFANSGKGVSVIPLVGVTEDLSKKRVAVMPLVNELTIHFYAIYQRKGSLSHAMPLLFPDSVPADKVAPSV